MTVQLTRALLQELYVEQKLSSSVIAKRFLCHPTTVRNRLRRFGLPVRTLLEADRYRINTRSPGQIKYPRRDFGEGAPQQAYLIGFRRGDLTAKLSNNGPHAQTIEIQCRTTQFPQAQLFKSLFAEYGHIHESPPDRHGALYLTAYVNRSFEFLLPKHDSVEDWIRGNHECAVAFAAGYIDAEGSFHTYRAKTNLIKSAFAIASQDRNVLCWMHEWLLAVDVPCPPPKLSIPKGAPRQFSLNKDYWILQVHQKRSLIRLIELLRPWVCHLKRKADMERVLQSIRVRNTRPGLKFASRSHRLEMARLTTSL